MPEFSHISHEERTHFRMLTLGFGSREQRSRIVACPIVRAY